MTMSKEEQIRQLEEQWKGERWKGITRPYSAYDVVKLRGSVLVEHTLAKKEQRNYGSLLMRKILLMRLVF